MEGLGADSSSSTSIIPGLIPGPGAIPARLVTTLAAAVGPALMIGSTVALLGVAARVMWENWPGQDSLEDGPERTIRGPGGRERTTTAPLSYIERRNMEEYGTIDREEIQKIQMERAGYATPEVIDSKPLTDLSQEDTVKAQTENPALIQAVKDMPAAQRDAFLEVNPHMKPLVNDTAEIISSDGKPTQGEKVSELLNPGTGAMPLIGAGVLSMEAQGLEKVVSPTADAVNNMSDLVENILSSITNNIQNITNNTTSGGGNSAPPILVNPSTIKNIEFNMMEFMKRVH